MTRAAVIGAGAWGTALAQLLATNGHDVALWAREEEVVADISEHRENRMFLAGFRLHDRISATNSIDEALGDRGLVVFAAPSEHLRRAARASRAYVAPGTVTVVATKGIDAGSLALMTTVVSEELEDCQVVALSGPSFASEVAANQPTAVVAASDEPQAAARAQSAFSNSTFRVYTSDDVIGVELGGALKNVMAVATGIADGAGLGFNSRAALITRGLAEMTRLGVALGARAKTFAGLAGMGDLVLTCTGALSRNRAIGVEIGRGARLEDALAGKHTVAEGVVTSRTAALLAAQTAGGVEMPIVEMVNRILFEHLPASDALAALMARELRPEQDP